MEPFLPAMPTMKSAAPPAMVMVVIHWDDRVIFAGVVEPGARCRLGEGPGAIPVPSSILGADQLSIVVHRQGEPRVVLPRRATGSFAVGPAPAQSIDQLRPLGTLRRMAPESVELSLPVHALVRLALDPLTVVVSRTHREPEIRRHGWGGLSRRLAYCHAAAAIPFIALLGAGAAALPALGETPGDASPREEPVALHVLGVGFDGHAVREPEIGLARDSEVQSAEWVPGDGVPCRCAPTGADMGCLEAERDGRYGVMGPADNPDPHIARIDAHRDATHWEAIPWSLSPLVGHAGDADAPTAPWGRDEALGTDPISARGHLFGDEIAAAFGDHGLAPDWQEGGLVKVIEPSPADGPTATPPVRVTHSGLVIQGAVSARAVLQALAPRLLAARECYRAALARTPNLAGRVDVELGLPADGQRPPRVRVTSPTIHDDRLTSCIAAAFEGVSLSRSAPLPDEGCAAPGDRVLVTYPIRLSPGR